MSDNHDVSSNFLHPSTVVTQYSSGLNVIGLSMNFHLVKNLEFLEIYINDTCNIDLVKFNLKLIRKFAPILSNER